VILLFCSPEISSLQVIGRDGFLLGAESTYSVPTGSITRYALGLGYAAPSYTVTVHGLANLSVFSASYYHKVSKDVEAGAKAIWDSKSTASNVGLEVGTKAYLDVSSPFPFCSLEATIADKSSYLYRTLLSSRPRSTTPVSSPSVTLKRKRTFLRNFPSLALTDSLFALSLLLRPSHVRK
jgi:hypothetical protein